MKNGDIQQAIRLTGGMDHALATKALSLIYIASFLATTGDSEKAEQTLRQSLSVFEKAVMNEPAKLDFRQLSVVSGLIETDQLQKATKAAQTIQVPPMKVLALVKVADARIERGDRLKAKELLSEALEKAGNNGDSLGWVAQSYAQVGEVATALEIVNGIPREFDRSYAYKRIADIQTQKGEAKNVLIWVRDLKSPYLKSSALLGIGFGILQKYGIDVAMSVL